MLTRRVPLLSFLALLLTTGLVAGCGGDSSDNGGGGGGGGGNDDDAASLLKKAFATDIASGTAKVEVSADVDGNTGSVKGPFKLSLNGPFKSQGKNKVPLVDWDYAVGGGGTSLNGKLIATGDNAFFGFQGQNYEVGEAQYKQFVDQAEQNSGENDSLSQYGVKAEEWLQDPKVSDGADVGGDSTKQITGTVDVDKMVRDLVKLAENPKVAPSLGGGARTPKINDADVKKVTDALEDAKFTVNVDDENRLRKLNFSTSFNAPSGSSSSVKGGKVRFNLSFPEVDTNPTIKAPSDARPIQMLLQQFGGMGAGGLGGLKTN